MPNARMRLVVLAITLIAAATSVGSGRAAQPATASDADIADALKFRTTFGLDAAPSLLELAATSPDYSTEPYGVPLSTAEIAELQRRVAVERAVWDAADYGAKQPEWAGYYFDQRDAGTPVFLLTENVELIGSRISAHIPEDVVARFEQASYSMTYLKDLQARIFADRDELSSDGIALTGLGWDVVRNSVEVDVEKLDDSVKAALAARYGAALTFDEEGQATADACVSTNNCRPIKGGLKIHNQSEPDSDNLCTSGFVVRRWYNGAYPLALLTAGHCIAGHPVNTDWEHNLSLSTSAAFLGESKWHTWGSKAINNQVRESDVGIIQIDNRSGNIPTTANQFFSYNGTNHILSVVRYIPTGNQTSGTQICAYGSLSNLAHCAPILNINEQHSSLAWGVTHWINNTNEYDWNLISGDSGGPIYQVWGSDRAAVGTHVHSTPGGGSTGYGWYTPFAVGQVDYADVTGADGHQDYYYLCTDANC